MATEIIDLNPDSCGPAAALAANRAIAEEARSHALDVAGKLPEVRNELLVHFTRTRDELIRHYNGEHAQAAYMLDALDRRIDDALDELRSGFEQLGYAVLWLSQHSGHTEEEMRDAISRMRACDEAEADKLVEKIADALDDSHNARSTFEDLAPEQVSDETDDDEPYDTDEHDIVPDDEGWDLSDADNPVVSA